MIKEGEIKQKNRHFSEWKMSIILFCPSNGASLHVFKIGSIAKSSYIIEWKNLFLILQLRPQYKIFYLLVF
jgi:hypothetical protein